MPLQNWIKCDHTSFWADCSQEWPEIYIFVTWVRRTLLMWLWSLRMVSGWRLTRWSWLPSAASAWQKQASASTDFYEGNSEQYFGGIWPSGIMLNARIYLANFYTSRKVCDHKVSFRPIDFCKFLLFFVPYSSLKYFVSRDSLSLIFLPVKIPPVVR